MSVADYASLPARDRDDWLFLRDALSQKPETPSSVQGRRERRERERALSWTPEAIPDGFDYPMVRGDEWLTS